MRFIWENDIFASQILHKIAALHEISLSFQFLENDALKKYNDNLPRKEKEFRVFSRENIHIRFLNLEKLITCFLYSIIEYLPKYCFIISMYFVEYTLEIVENVVQILTSLIYPLGLLLVFFFVPNVCSVFLRLLW